MKCPGPGCVRQVDRSGLCHGHFKQRKRGATLSKLRPWRPLKPAKRAQVEALYARGMNIGEIARRVNLNRSMVWTLCKHPKRTDRAEVGPDMPEPVQQGRCRCFLALPCNSCLPSIADLASSRRGDSAGFGA